MSRRTAALLLAPLLAAPLLVTSATPAAARPEVTRVAGPDRYATAVLVSRASHPGPVDTVVIATGAGFADALAGGAAASSEDAPLLLTAPAALPEVVRQEVERLDPSRLLVLGGPAAVGDSAIATSTAAGREVVRVAGADRYETAALLSREVFATSTATAYVATGTDFPDALAGAAAAGRDGAPVLLTAPGALPAATAAELDRLDLQRIVVLGGEKAVSSAVAQQLAAYAPSVVRVAGEDRYATAAALAAARDGLPPAAYLATGLGFADALAGGPAAVAAGAPVLLVRPDCIPVPADRELDRYGDVPVVLLGGSSALGPGAAELRPCFRVPDGELAPGVRLTTIDDPRGPWKGKLVEVSPSAAGRVDAVLAQDELPGLETTTSMARRTGALVAVNGDFALPGGRPVHAFARDGRLLQTPQALGNNLVVPVTGPPHLGHPTLDVRLDVPATGARLPVGRINSGPAPADALSLTTREGQGAPEDIGCAAALRPLDGPGLVGGRATQRYSVVATDCAGGDLDTDLDLLTATPGGAGEALLASLAPGQDVAYSWTIGWPDVLDTIGGNPVLVAGGSVLAGNVDGTDGFSRRNPRTAVGYRPDGTLLLVTVDGRGAQGSVGMSLRELAQLFVRLGASDALNLDGGGSTAVVVSGELQNVPSDGPERPVSSALVVSSAPPAGGALRRGPVAPEVLPEQQQRAVERQQQADPGSTGGLLRQRTG